MDVYYSSNLIKLFPLLSAAASCRFRDEKVHLCVSQRHKRKYELGNCYQHKISLSCRYFTTIITVTAKKKKKAQELASPISITRPFTISRCNCFYPAVGTFHNRTPFTVMFQVFTVRINLAW